MLTFYEKYIKLCASVNKSPSKVAEENSISRPAVNAWKIGRSKPSDVTLSKLAAYFNVPVEYFKNDIEAKEKAAPISGDDFSERDIEILKKVDLLNPVMQRLLLSCSALDAEDLERIAGLAESLAKAKAHQ